MVRAARRSAKPLGVRGPVLRPPCMRQRSLPWIAGARQGQPERVRAPQRAARARVGLPRGILAGGGAAAGVSGEAGVAAGERADIVSAPDQRAEAIKVAYVG